jgi:hypothetical protein
MGRELNRLPVSVEPGEGMVAGESKYMNGS